MANILSVFQFAAPVWVVFERIEWHKRPGGILEGLKWSREGTLRGESARTLPSLQPYFVDMASLSFEGARQPSDRKLGNTSQANTFILKLELATDIKHGFVRRDPEAIAERKGLLEWAGLVMDAIETNKDGQADALLERTLNKPVSFTLNEPEAGSASFASVLEVALDSRAFARGQRHYTFPDLSETNS